MVDLNIIKIMNYTYLIRFKPTGQLYYGSRTKKGGSETDLWSTYFTSSKKVHSLLKEYGPNAFEYEIRKRFETKAQTLLWEKKFLERVNARYDPKWLNQAANSSDFTNKGHTPETRKKLSEAGKRRRHSPETLLKLKASKQTPEFKEAVAKAGRSGKNLNRDADYRKKMSEALSGRKLSPEHRSKIAEANRRRARKNLEGL